jgi:hypothetical protein
LSNHRTKKLLLLDATLVINVSLRMGLLVVGKGVGETPRFAFALNELYFLEKGLFLLVKSLIGGLHLAFLHALPHSQQFLLQVAQLSLHDVLQLHDVPHIRRHLLVLLVVEVRHPEEGQLPHLVLEPHRSQMLNAHVPVYLHVVDHLVRLIQAVLLGHFLEHLLVLLQVLQRDVLLGELGEQADLGLHLDEAAVEHEHVVRLAVLDELAEDELALLLMRLDVALDEFDVLRLDVGLHDAPQLLLVDQFQSLVAVFDDGHLSCCVLMNLENLVLLLALLVAVEGVVLGPVVGVVVAEPVLEAGHDRLEVLYVVVLALAEVRVAALGVLPRVQEEVGDLFAELGSD